MAEERKIIIQSGNGSLDDMLNIAATGIAALIFQSMMVDMQYLRPTLEEGRRNDEK